MIFSENFFRFGLDLCQWNYVCLVWIRLWFFEIFWSDRDVVWVRFQVFFKWSSLCSSWVYVHGNYFICDRVIVLQNICLCFRFRLGHFFCQIWFSQISSFFSNGNFRFGSDLLKNRSRIFFLAQIALWSVLFSGLDRVMC